MKINYRVISIVVLTLLLVLILVPTASAYESRSGDIVTVKADEVIDEDLYVSAETFILDGTIKGDLFVVGRHVIINGVLGGDLMGAAQDITINGELKDDARVVGAVIILTEKAKVEGDVMAMSYSMETKAGSQVKGALLGGSSQAFFGGEVAKDLKYAAGGIDIEGKVGGNVEVEVGSPDDVAPTWPMQFFEDLPAIPSVKGGLSIGEAAQLEGNITIPHQNQLLFLPMLSKGKLFICCLN
jgi:cytoskeletal protein CcmA (bactofilin family)